MSLTACTRPGGTVWRRVSSIPCLSLMPSAETPAVKLKPALICAHSTPATARKAHATLNSAEVRLAMTSGSSVNDNSLGPAATPTIRNASGSPTATTNGQDNTTEPSRLPNLTLKISRSGAACAWMAPTRFASANGLRFATASFARCAAGSPAAASATSRLRPCANSRISLRSASAVAILR